MVEAYWTDKEPDFTLYCGDNRVVMPQLSDASVDAIVTDPPYELGFMGKGWDRSGIAYDAEVWRECLRVLKPGGHLLAFGGSRTYHRLACAIEDAGFEIRDQIQWLYGSGFPKSLNVSGAVDSYLGVEPKVIGTRAAVPGVAFEQSTPYATGRTEIPITEAGSWAAKQWEGWGTALKPAHEPIVLARKPIVGTVAENVMIHGTGGLNIDGCRIEAETLTGWHGDPSFGFSGGLHNSESNGRPVEGRWPANVIHDGSEEVVSLFPNTEGGSASSYNWQRASNDNPVNILTNIKSGIHFGDSGSAARFFYVPKADKVDRGEGLDDLPHQSARAVTDRQDGSAGLNSPRAGAGRTSGSRNSHPTVKPTDLMRYLCRLITPLNGLVLDPFCGSGSTGKAARAEGFRFIGIEINEEYCALAAARCEISQRSLFG